MPSDWNLGMADDLISSIDPDVKCVIAAFDHHLSYVKLAKAASILSRPNTIYIATNTDEQFPYKENTIIPGEFK